jgi:tRNA threonylcarbamoyl adenosine modification protein (Sua5/YciO/YrdC/YwlC family)
VARVYRAKGRPADHPLIVHVQGAQALAGWSAQPNPAAERLAEAFWPGALTVVVARSDRAGDFITGGQDTVALRCPDHPVARACLEALARLSGDPARGVAAPSANRFGRVSPTRALDVLAEVGSAMDPERDLVVDGGACAIGVESTIVDCTATPPRVLRLGAISQEQVDAALAASSGSPAGAAPGPIGTPGPARSADETETQAPAVVEDAADPVRDSAREGDGTNPVGAREGGAADVRAPGTLESHYAPLAAVLLVELGHASTTDLVALAACWAAQAAGQPADRRATPSRQPTEGCVGQPERDPFGLMTLEGSEPAWIMGDGSPAAPSVGLVAPSEVATPDGWARLAAPVATEDYARELYAALRRADELGLDVVVAVLPDAAGGPLALAVRDRLARAAHGDGS